MALTNIALLDLFARTAVAAVGAAITATASRTTASGKCLPTHGTRAAKPRGHAAEQCLEKVLRRGRGHRREKRRDRDAGHEDVFDAAPQAGLATDPQSEGPPTPAPAIPRRTISQQHSAAGGNMT